MSYNVKSIPFFDKQAKRLAKKFPSFKKELAELIDLLESAPDTGTPLGNDCYKIRIAIKSKGKGKSGGARAVTHIVAVKEEVFLLSVYDKSEQETISEQTLKKLLEEIE